MNEQIKSFYLAYKGRVATPVFENGDGIATKVIALADAFAALGYEMELHADLLYVSNVNDGDESEK